MRFGNNHVTLLVMDTNVQTAQTINQSISQKAHSLFEYVIFNVTCPNFWKRVVMYTLLMAMVGHLIENAYTGLGYLLGSFETSDSNFVDVWLRPFKPMWVYSVCTIFFFFIVINLKEKIHRRVRSKCLNVSSRSSLFQRR